jgi:AcrR family transcriptional regulator
VKPVPNEEVKIQNVDRTLQVASELFLEHGIEGTTKEMIVRASGLSRKSIDRYFSDKPACVLQVAHWVGCNIWGDIIRHYPKAMFTDGIHTGATILEMYLLDLKKTFMRDPRLFVFYSDFKIYFSRHSGHYQRDYHTMVDTIGCYRLALQIYELGKRDGSLGRDIDPQEEAAYFCQTVFGFFTNMALEHEYHAKEAESQIEQFVCRVLSVYCGKPALAM